MRSEVSGNVNNEREVKSDAQEVIGREEEVFVDGIDCNQSPSEHIDVCKLVEIMHINYLEVNLVEAVKPALTVQVEFLGRKVAMEVDTAVSYTHLTLPTNREV